MDELKTKKIGVLLFCGESSKPHGMDFFVFTTSGHFELVTKLLNGKCRKKVFFFTKKSLSTHPHVVHLFDKKIKNYILVEVKVLSFLINMKLFETKNEQSST